jgi:hypothetical protein
MTVAVVAVTASVALDVETVLKSSWTANTTPCKYGSNLYSPVRFSSHLSIFRFSISFLSFSWRPLSPLSHNLTVQEAIPLINRQPSQSATVPSTAAVNTAIATPTVFLLSPAVFSSSVGFFGYSALELTVLLMTPCTV